MKEVKRAGQVLAREMKEAGELAQELIEGTAVCGANYANLRSEAATLKEFVEVARNLNSGDPQDWQKLPRDIIQRLLVGIALWAQKEGRNPMLSAPGAVRSKVPSYSRITLADALIWALSGVFTDEERQALSAGR